MTAAKIIGAIAGSFVIAYVCDSLISDRKIFGGKLQFMQMLHYLRKH